MTQAQHEHDEAHSHTEKADNSSREDDPSGGQCRTGGECEAEVHRSGHQSLDHSDLNRVGRRELAGEVVVNAPGEAGARDQKRASVELQAAAACREQNRASEYGQRAEQKSPVDVLAKDDQRQSPSWRAPPD